MFAPLLLASIGSFVPRYGQVIARDSLSAMGLAHLRTTLRGFFPPKRVVASQPAKHRVSGMSLTVQRATGG
jgi:hypothetical protein